MLGEEALLKEYLEKMDGYSVSLSSFQLFLGLITEPSTERPPNTPLERENDRMSEVWAAVLAPTGPAVMLTSAPSLKLAESRESTPFWVITIKTTSATFTPA